jgi:Na+/H+ antiporter NhaD/arsenite permease-like protein
MTAFVLAVFVLTYLGMAAGRIPGLRIERTGIAVLAVAALLVFGAVPLAAAGRLIDAPTVVFLFALMVISAQFEGSGFYDRCARAITTSATGPFGLLAATVLVASVLSALLANDIVVFALTPLLCAGLRARGVDPRPYLIGLAGGSNAGSAATIIGNPQNILIGQVGGLDFWAFVAVNGVPALLAMGLVVLATAWIWSRELGIASATPQTALPSPVDRRQLGKALLAMFVLIFLFATPVPREVAALAVAAVLFLSRTMSSRGLLGRVDWNLLVLFVCLFVVTGVLAELPLVNQAVGEVAAAGLLPDRLAIMAPLALVLSNSIGNVPADVLLLALWTNPGEGALYGLALLSTLAGNFLIVGSIANLIVAERARVSGVSLSFLDFARAGIPMTLGSMIVAVLWLWGGGWMPLW